MTVLAMCVLALAAFASPAMAEYQTAKFDKSSLKLSTTGLTLERAGGSAKTCTPTSAISGPVSGGSWASLQNVFGTGVTWFNCTGGTQLEMVLFSEAQRDSGTGATRLSVGNNSTRTSPYGTYTGQTFTAAYTNGTGAATPSKITFSKTVIGADGVGNLTLTGTFNVMYNATETVKIVP